MSAILRMVPSGEIASSSPVLGLDGVKFSAHGYHAVPQVPSGSKSGGLGSATG